jgi:flagellar basal body-associated protein FliL
MNNIEPTLEMIEDYDGNESKEKRKTIWIVILSGLFIGAIYGIISVNSSVSDESKTKTHIMKY